MSTIAHYVFWTGLFIVAYTYLIYGMVIIVLARLAKRRPPAPIDTYVPDVTLVIAAYNEEAFIEEKIENTRQLNYPAGKLDVMIVTDGSTDGTPAIVSRYPFIKHYHQPERRGKIHAVNRVMKYVETPIVVFCDANTLLSKDAVKLMVRHYQDPEVGGVSGEKRIFTDASDNASGSGEGLYWKYESFLKRKDAQTYSLVGAAGELFSIRTSLFEAPPADSIIEDFYMSMKITQAGHRFAYEPDAIATETASVSVDEEWKRKVRICAGGFQAMARLLPLLNPFRFGMLSFQYVSHRVLRWTLAPLCLPLILLSNLVLAMQPGMVYKVFLGGQILFYTIAVAGHWLRDKKVSVKGFFVPYYFVVMNVAVFFGLARYLRGKQSVVWEKAERVSRVV